MLVFAEGKQAASAKKLGAAYVGREELIPNVWFFLCLLTVFRIN